MNTKYKFPEIFREKLKNSANRIIKTKTSKLEKLILEEHKLFTEICTLSWKGKEKKGKLGFFIGGAEGLDNVHEAYILAKAIKESYPDIKAIFITSGAIGVALNKAKEMGVPGVNAKVMTKLLTEYKVPKEEIITEAKSLHTDMQAQEIKKILEREKINQVILVADYWHATRLLMTMVRTIKNISWYTYIVERDKDNINDALFDWGQEIFQTPLLIAEVARIHEYFDKKMGPCSLDELMEYLVQYHPRHLERKIKEGKISRLKFLWEITHKEIISNFEKYKNFR